MSVRVLRHYEAQSLIRSERDSNRYREYPSEAIEIVKVIRTLLHCGFSTRQIRELPLCIGGRIDGSPKACAASVQMHHSKLKELDSLIEVLEQRRRDLLDRIKLYACRSHASLTGPPPEQSREMKGLK